jgi:phosphopantothenoylcysteine decarboxylase / phosphopantothenate---cysteine ligase
MLPGRRILLGVTGGIAAYKAVMLARRLVEARAEVKVMMSRGATEFVGPRSFAAVTRNPVATDLFAPGTVSPHTELAEWADLIVVAPATTSLLGRLAAGISDDLVSTTLIAARSPVLLAPAMHTEMWEHPATRRVVAQLVADGHHLIGPASGSLAGGDEGPGRMVEPEDILAEVLRLLARGPLSGVRVLVTAGGTREPIDPVRYVGNRSSGRMGHTIAEEASRRGADVVLVTTSSLDLPRGVDVVTVETAEEMAEAVWGRAAQMDVVVMAAAVADFRPKERASTKLSRGDGPPDVVFEPTPDILGGVADLEPRPFLVGFSAETGSLDRAVEKAKRKGSDLTVANDVTKKGSGFGTDTNEVALIEAGGIVEHWPLMTKREVASRLWDRLSGALAGTD